MIAWIDWLTFLAACVVVVIVPGPTVTVIIANSLRHGARAGLLQLQALAQRLQSGRVQALIQPDQADVGKHVGDAVGAARDIGGVLEHGHVAGHQRRCQEAEHLPDREIPRHHRQHAADGLVGDVAARGIGADGLVGQVAAGVVGVVLAGGGGLLDLGERLAAQLAHVAGHQGGNVLAAGA